MKDPRTRDRTRRRRQKIKQERQTIQFNWFFLLVVLMLWGIFGFIVFYVEPELIKDVPFVGWYLPFFLSLFACVFATVYWISKSLKRSWLVSLLLTIFLVLRLNDLGQWYNGVILLVVGVVIEYVWIGRFEWVKKVIHKKDE